MSDLRELIREALADVPASALCQLTPAETQKVIEIKRRPGREGKGCGSRAGKGRGQ